ncbi:MAG: tetratricopeptide repeat protein, partial [Myxococcota bacterium]
QDVDDAEWREACARAGVSAAPGLAEALFERRLASAGSGGWSFVHGMLREAVERRAREGGRWVAWSRACADVLEAREGARGVAARRVRHLLAAEDPGAATACVERAVDELIVAGEFGQANGLVASWDALVSGRTGEDAERLTAMLRLARARVLDATEDPAAAVIAEPLEMEARLRSWPEIAAGACMLRANAERRRGAGRLGALLLENAAHEYAALGLRRWEGQARYHLGGLEMETGRFAQARAQLEEARESFVVAGHPAGVAVCDHALAHIWMLEGRLDLARPGLEAARAEFRRLGMRNRLAGAYEALGDVVRYLGEIDRAEECYREAMAMYDTMDVRPWTAPYNLGLVLIQRGRAAEARPWLDDALAAVGEKPGARTVVVVTQLACLAGDATAEEWDARLAEARSLLRATRRREPDMGLAAELAAQAALQAGYRERARDALAIARDQWSGLGRSAEAKAVEELLGALG